MKQIFQSCKDMLRILRKDHPLLPYVFLFGPLVGGGLPYYSLYFTSLTVNYLYQSNTLQAKQSVLFLLIGSFVIGCIQHICNQAKEVYCQTVNQTYNQQFTDKSYHLAYEKYERKETLEKIQMIRNNERGGNRISSQIDRIYLLMTKLVSTIFAIIYLVKLFFFTNGNSSILISLLFMLALIAFFYIIMKFNENGNKKTLEIRQRSIEANALGNYIFNLNYDPTKGKDIRIFGMSNMLLQFNNYVYDIFAGILNDQGLVEGKFSGLNALFLQLFSGLSFFYVGYQAIHHAIGVGDILLYAGAISQLMTSLTDIFANYSKIKFCFEKTLNLYHEFINSSDMDYDGTLPIEKRDDNVYHFQFEDVSFKYPGTDQMILNHINLDFNVGESYAIVGQNGAGKSTLIKLLCRLYEPTDGRILLNGIDIRKYSYEEYVQIFSVVFQDFKLYALNLDNNIACDECPDEERVKAVLKQVNIYEHIMEHPDGIHQLLYKETGDGVILSGGEAQKVAIARALYKDAPFVILDEPTSALDPISEAEIYENFHSMIKDKTAIYISHRMSSCRFCQHIIVLDQGTMVDFGSHDELMEHDGLYAKLWQTQAQYYE